jgi:transposase
MRRLTVLGFKPERILADKAYSNEKILSLIVELGAEPVIAFKSIYSKNRLPSSNVMRKLYQVFLNDREAFEDKNRERPLVEVGISALKRKFMEAVRGRTYRTQVNEILYKVLCHNIDVLVHAAIEYGFDVDRLIKGMDTPRAAAEG